MGPTMTEKPTVKKKKLTLKITRAATPTAGQDNGADEAEVLAAPTAPAKAVIDSAYHKPAAIIAIITALIFLGLIAVQLLEWTYYEQPPTVWPLKLVAPGAP